MLCLDYFLAQVNFVFSLIGCKPLGKFKRGNVLIQGSLINGKYSVGSVVKYHCNKAYRLVGSRRRTCLENGEWSGFKAKCVRRKLRQIMCGYGYDIVM